MDSPPRPVPLAADGEAEAFLREKRRLFARRWLPLWASGQLQAPGSFVQQTIGGWPVMAVRGSDGVLRGFHNVCRHQGMPVLDKSEGRCERMRCRFHGWTYDLTGALVEAPPLVAPANRRDGEPRLMPVEVIDASGLTFIRVERADDDEPPAMMSQIQSFSAAVTTDVACNWKTLVESMLPGEDWRFVWPFAFECHRSHGRIVRLALPRSFARTRLVDLVFGAASPLLEADIQRARTDMDAARHAAETIQGMLATGATAVASPAVAAFRARLAASG